MDSYTEHYEVTKDHNFLTQNVHLFMKLYMHCYLQDKENHPEACCRIYQHYSEEMGHPSPPRDGLHLQ